MTQMHIEYLGDLRTRATHEGSGESLMTDAPLDNHGKGEYFSPTDLLATSVGTCMLTLMGIAAQQKYKVDISGTQASVEKIMATAPSRRVGKLIIHIRCPHQFEARIQEGLERAAYSCPVHESLHPDVEQEIDFEWGG